MTTPAVGAPKKLMTVDEFWDFVHRPENENRNFELIRGEVIEMSRPTKPHGTVVLNIGLELGLYARRVGKGYLVTESGLVLEEDLGTVVGPDVAYYTDAEKFSDLHPKWGDVPPVLVVEVSSPNDRPGRMNAKIQEYLTNGVKIVWQVDYEERNVTVYRPDKTMEVVKMGGELTGGNELPGLSIKIADIFRLPGEHAANPTATPPPAPPQPPTST